MTCTGLFITGVLCLTSGGGVFDNKLKRCVFPIPTDPMIKIFVKCAEKNPSLRASCTFDEQL